MMGRVGDPPPKWSTLPLFIFVRGRSQPAFVGRQKKIYDEKWPFK